LPRRPSRLNGLRVLVVDDNATNRRILEEMLASWEMKPTVVAGAEAALDVLRRASPTTHRFDAMIADCQMPDVDGFALAREIKRDRHLQATPIVMLTSAGRPEDVARCRRIGIERYLTKPVKHSDLLDALVTLFGTPTRASKRRQGTKASSRATRRKLRVLVAEDNAVNRKLVTAVLKKRGHAVTAVETGRAVLGEVDAVRGPGFDVVLMDLQMPEMSGFEATQAIRDREGGRGKRLPIVALTAHAMQGDRERCLDAGMDGYLSKPIDVDQLIATVESIGGGTSAALRPPARPSSSPPSHAVFDEHAALAHTAGDRRLLKEMVALFRADVPSYLQRIGAALRRRDGEGLRMAAHGLKGALATVGSDRGREIAHDLEQMAAGGSFEGAADKCVRLRDHLKLLDKAFVAAGLIRPAASSGVTRKKRSRSRKRGGR
jgi:CheY-like chemotaxis protein